MMRAADRAGLETFLGPTASRATPLHSVALRALNVSLEKNLAENSRPS